MCWQDAFLLLFSALSEATKETRIKRLRGTGNSQLVENITCGSGDEMSQRLLNRKITFVSGDFIVCVILLISMRPSSTFFFRFLSVLLTSFLLTGCDPGVSKISGEFLRTSKIKGLNFTKTSSTDNARIKRLIPAGYDFRLGSWIDKWTVARDTDHLIYRGGASKTEKTYLMFLIVWSNSKGRVVFSEMGHKSSGSYPSGLISSP